MKKNIMFILFACLVSFAVSAQGRGNGGPRGGARPEFSFEQYQQNKCDFIVKEMELSEEDQGRFLPVYKELLAAKSSLYRKYGGAHRIMRSVSQGEQVPDTTMQRAVQNARQLQLEDAQLEQDYLAKFEKILTPVQVIRLQEAEQKFKNEMMKRGPRGRH